MAGGAQVAWGGLPAVEDHELGLLSGLAQLRVADESGLDGRACDEPEEAGRARRCRTAPLRRLPAVLSEDAREDASLEASQPQLLVFHIVGVHLLHRQLLHDLLHDGLFVQLVGAKLFRISLAIIFCAFSTLPLMDLT